MHAVGVLQKCLADVLGHMHAARSRTLLEAVSALLAGRRLVLMDLARAWPGAERVRAPLKRLDRLLGNPFLQAECRTLYGAMAQWLIRHPRPVIIIDWSELQPNGRWHLLRAGIPIGGRTVTIFEAVYPERLKNSPRAEGQLLVQLCKLLPAGVTPVVVTDAGFRAPWFRAVRRLGWDYVGRVRHRTRVRLGPRGPWVHNRDLHRLATRAPTRYDGVQIADRKSVV